MSESVFWIGSNSELFEGNGKSLKKISKQFKWKRWSGIDPASGPSETVIQIVTPNPEAEPVFPKFFYREHPEAWRVMDQETLDSWLRPIRNVTPKRKLLGE